MNKFNLTFLFSIFLFTMITFSSQEQIKKINSPTYILTNEVNIVREIFYFLNYLEIQTFFKSFQIDDKKFTNMFQLKFSNFNFQKSLRHKIYLGPNFFPKALLLKKITIFLSKLHKILLCSPVKFEKRIFKVGIHEEYFLSKDKEKNTDFLPFEELQNIQAPIYPFLISHAIRLKSQNDKIDYIFLRNDGACQMFGFVDIFQNLRLSCSSNCTKIRGNGKLNVLYKNLGLDYDALTNLKFEFMFFSGDFSESDNQFLHLFFKSMNNMHRLTFSWWLDDKFPSLVLPTVLEQITYSFELFLHFPSDGLGFFIYDEKTHMLYHECHVFREQDGTFVEHRKICIHKIFADFKNEFKALK